MKSVMLSIKPRYCEMIASGQKTIEVRKTRPKIETPFKCYIYQTKTVYVSKNKANEFLKPIQDKRFGKAICEFICDRIDKIVHGGTSNENIQLCIMDDDGQHRPLSNEYLYQTGLTYAELDRYSNGGNLYGWHISSLKIYDKPKGLREFWHCGVKLGAKVSRPPQSWYYVEDKI